MKRIIAIKEKSAGNATIGDTWLETKSFPEDTPVSEIMKWGSDATGKLILTKDQDTPEKSDVPF